MITSTLASRAPEVSRARDDLGDAKRPPRVAQSDNYAGETELSKLIRYGCQFELQVHQMVELSTMRAENTRLREAKSKSECNCDPQPSGEA